MPTDSERVHEAIELGLVDGRMTRETWLAAWHELNGHVSDRDLEQLRFHARWEWAAEVGTSPVGEDCYDELPRTVVEDVSALLCMAEPVRLEDVPGLEARVAELKAEHDPTAEELAFVDTLCALSFKRAREGAK